MDSLGNSIIVSESPTEPGALTAVLTPLIDHPEARDRVVPLRRAPANSWRCGTSAGAAEVGCVCESAPRTL